MGTLKSSSLQKQTYQQHQGSRNSTNLAVSCKKLLHHSPWNYHQPTCSRSANLLPVPDRLGNADTKANPRFFTVVMLKTQVVWDVKPFWLAKTFRRFEETWCLRLLSQAVQPSWTAWLYRQSLEKSARTFHSSSKKLHKRGQLHLLTPTVDRYPGYFDPVSTAPSSASWCTRSNRLASTGTGRTAPWRHRYWRGTTALEESQGWRKIWLPLSPIVSLELYAHNLQRIRVESKRYFNFCKHYHYIFSYKTILPINTKQYQDTSTQMYHLCLKDRYWKSKLQRFKELTDFKI